MNQTISVLFVILLFSITSCVPFVPMVGTSGIAYTPNLRDKFDEESERILVLPVWEVYPFHSYERHPYSRSTRTFGKPLLITVKESSDLPELIPTKTSSILMGMADAIGRSISIEGVVIISERGKIITINCSSSEKSNWSMERCENLHMYCIDQNWKNNLIHIFTEESRATNSFGYSVPALSKLLIPCCFGRYVMNELDKVKFKLSNTADENELIIKFLNEITVNCNSNY